MCTHVAFVPVRVCNLVGAVIVSAEIAFAAGWGALSGGPRKIDVLRERRSDEIREEGKVTVRKRA